jgi:hypothetical protein
VCAPAMADMDMLLEATVEEYILHGTRQPAACRPPP